MYDRLGWSAIRRDRVRKFGFFENIINGFLGGNNKRGGFGRSGGGICLVGKIFLDLGGVFLSYFGGSKAPYMKKTKTNTK